MSYKWPDKDKDEIVDYSVDWSRFLKEDTILGVTWSIKGDDGINVELFPANIIKGLQFVSGTVSGQVATVRFSLGLNNIRYTVVCGISTGSGLHYERSIFLRVKEK